ncbi:carboxylate-amine ligase [Phytohabitans rumicis]|uniref:Putative glutamate--cysteine ligase 2 n=1 Tax=Phytohabitans rumicis TaxID=1076125 RepID=A0A6V8LDZ4_9ACTN|nr:glutamate--cysteine ligase [Phytohabitans rumicis]GFJ92257.1 putative glutamate--cysteine ligase 2 [Phytohabitans rumicis]
MTIHWPRLGVEEEFLVVDPVTREVTPGAAAVVSEAERHLGTRVCGEITKLQVETRTAACHTTVDLHAQLVEARSALASAAAAEQLRVMASGSPVLGRAIPPPMTEGPRQDRGNAMFRGLHDELSICAVHVHVESPDRERAVRISNHLRPYLPTLIALTANSPYWAERDTGYASWRTMTWHRWPVAGPPPYFTSADHYDGLVDTLLDAGALVDKGTIFWDVRLSAHQPTLEVRASDVPVSAAESAALAALVRGLVVAAGRAVDAGDPGPQVQPELMRLAYWRAARDGFGGCGVDVHSGQLKPAAELAHRLLDVARPALADMGDLDRVSEWLRQLGSEGDGATRQRRVAARAGGLTDVVDHLVARTAAREESTKP